MCVIQSNFTKTNPNFFQNGGRAPGAPVLDPPLILYVTNKPPKYIYFPFQNLQKMYIPPSSYVHFNPN